MAVRGEVITCCAFRCMADSAIRKADFVAGWLNYRSVMEMWTTCRDWLDKRTSMHIIGGNLWSKGL